MIKANGEWQMVSDMGWSNRGWTAYHGSLPIVWFEQKLIVTHEILSKEFKRDGDVWIPGNYRGSSGGMEGHALRAALRYLHDQGILSMATDIIMDKDSTASSIIKDELTSITGHLKVRYDPGHVMKSMVNQLRQVRE